jgi:hypothetical protein
MLIKIDFKSNFKIKNSFSKKNSNKNIFIKNMVIFLLFSKLFLQTCKVTILISKKKKILTNLLKAPSRHKKFFHQIFHEIFRLRVFFLFNNILINSYHPNNIKKLHILNSVNFFSNLDKFFTKIGSNVLSKNKFSFKCFVSVKDILKL